MIFLTVGTLFPFDRLVRTVDEAAHRVGLDEELFGQIGPSTYVPRHMRYVDRLPKAEFDELIEGASGLIGHAGIGTITMALQHNKPLLVLPRLHRYGEHVNDHQLGTARKFESLGHVMAAYSEDELIAKLHRLADFVPTPRTPQPEAVAGRIRRFIGPLTP